MDSPSAPAAPDPTATANAQTTSNVQTAKTNAVLNNPNVITPYGQQTVTWGPQGFDQAGYDAANAKYQTDLANYTPGMTRGGFGEDGSLTQTFGGGQAPTAPTREQFMGTGATQPTVTQTLNPDQQSLLNSQVGMSKQMAGIGQQGLNAIGSTLATPLSTQSGADATAKAYAAMQSRLDPQWNQATQQQETQLRNQGVAPGTEAYTNAMRTFNQGKNDAYQQANLGAMAAAPQQQQMDISGRDALLNELNAVRTGSQVQTPQFQQYNPSQVNPTNTMAAQQMQQNGLLNTYNAGVGQANNFNSGLMSMAGTAGTAALMY